MLNKIKSVISGIKNNRNFSISITSLKDLEYFNGAKHIFSILKNQNNKTKLMLVGGCVRKLIKQEEIKSRGHAIEIRINAEDPANQFFPSPGKILDFRAPDGPGTRFDSMLYLGYEIPPFYDSLIGKLIVWDENRDKAIKRLKRTIGELNICGIKTNVDMLRLLTEDKQINAGPVNTNWLENWLKTNLNYLN